MYHVWLVETLGEQKCCRSKVLALPTFDCDRGWIPLLHMWFEFGWVSFSWSGVYFNQSISQILYFKMKIVEAIKLAVHLSNSLKPEI